MAQNTTQNCLRYVKGVMIIVDLKMKDAKRGEFKKEWYWSGHLIRRYR